MPIRRAAVACAPRRARADHEIVVVELRHELYRIGRTMLAVPVDDQDARAGRVADAGFHGGAVPFVVRVPNHRGSAGRRPRARIVGRPVVDDEDLVPRSGAAQVADDRRDRGRFVEGRDDDGGRRWISHQLWPSAINLATTPSQVMARARS